MPRAGLTADRLTRAGAQLADEVGLAHVTLSALARGFDVKVASLYSHLESSADLKARIAVLALEELADRGAHALAGRSGADALTALGGVYRDYAREHPGRYDASRHPLDPASGAARVGVRHAEMARAVLRGYDLDEPDQTHAVRLMGSVFHGFTSLELAGGFSHSSPDSGASWAWSLAALDTMLRHGRTTPS